jgi:hypothetical protein
LGELFRTFNIAKRKQMMLAKNKGITNATLSLIFAEILRLRPAPRLRNRDLGVRQH